jgi:hypothetical protein
MTESNSIDVSKKLSPEESAWLQEQVDKIVSSFDDDVSLKHMFSGRGMFSEFFDKLGEAERKKQKGLKKEWVISKCKRLEALGIIAETIYLLLRQKVVDHDIEISDSYLRTLIIKTTGQTIPRNAYYDKVMYLDYAKVRQLRLEYIETGEYFLKQIRKSKGEIELTT